LRWKGVVLDSLLEDHLVAAASKDPNQSAAVNQLVSLKQRLLQLTLQVPKDLSNDARQQRDADIRRLSDQAEGIEQSLGRQVAGLGHARHALSVTVPEVQAVLAKEQVLVELLRYSHYLGKGKFDVRYGAVLIGPQGDPQWAPLGEAGSIEDNVKAYQQSVRGYRDETALSTVLRALYAQIWAPIAKALPAGCRTVIVSPDGELNFVSFATLLAPDGRFLAEEDSIRYVASGRDLLRDYKPTGKEGLVIFADPQFSINGNSADNGPETKPVAMRGLEMQDMADIHLSPLPGTAKEGEALRMQADAWNWPVSLYEGAHATEAQLRAIVSPHILHLATHGFFLPDTDTHDDQKAANQALDREVVIEENPMHRSGLALAGAQTTFDAWKRGVVPPTENDGIVTAEEVGGLSLQGTWLVTLSACDTGSGEARAGEGVMGLRRGFIQAGVQNLLMTLWSISDEETANLMVDFYSAAEKTGNAPEALAQVQRDWLVRLRKEKGLLYAVEQAGAFIMSSQGRP
jgi:CHAT domain-containing protein